MNSAIFTKSAKGLILASGLIAASSILGYAQDAPVALGTQATLSLSGYYMTIPTGQASLGGHSFDMTSGNAVKMLNGGTATFTGSYQNAKAVYLLLNTANTSNMYSGSVVGTVVLTFSDATTQSTDLLVGGNLREWRVGAAGVVNTLTDPAAAPVWTTTAQASMGGGSAVLDMLTIPVATTGKTLTTVTVTDTNGFGSLQIDLAGLTADFTPPAPPAPKPTPTPTPTPTPVVGGGSGAGRDEDKAGDDQADQKIAVEAAKAAEKADRNGDKVGQKATTKPAKKPAKHHDD
ncbi:MAG TPA: hypothetical protein VG125_19635 [Pirellulales bacterium]|nr:hypothetical protein [Pirellulales bacterium]